MTPPDLSALRAAALGALAVDEHTPDHEVRVYSTGGGSITEGREPCVATAHCLAWGQFMTKASPQAVLALIERVEAAEHAIRCIMGETEPPFDSATPAAHVIRYIGDLQARAIAAEARLASAEGERWWHLTDNLPSYGQPVWCYWPGARRGEPGMQGCAVRSIHMPMGGIGDMTPADYWHAEDDLADTRFAPLAWRPLPAPPAASAQGRAGESGADCRLCASAMIIGDCPHQEKTK